MGLTYWAGLAILLNHVRKRSILVAFHDFYHVAFALGRHPMASMSEEEEHVPR